MKTLVHLFSLYLLIIDYGLCKDFKCSLEAFMKKSVEEEIQFPTLLKRQLSSYMSEDSSDAYGGIDPETVERATEETSLNFHYKKATQSKLSPPTSTIKSLKSDSCQCKASDVANQGESAIKDPTTVLAKTLIPDVRKLDKGSRKDFTTSTATQISTQQSEAKTNQILPTSPTSQRIQGFEDGLDEKHLEVNETEFQIKIDLSDVCPYFRDIPDMDVDKMEDVWHLVNYRSQEKLTCFRIYINKTLPENQKHYEQKFSSFNETINWKECHLEVTSTGNPTEEKRHFLQGNKNNRGVLENIVLSQEIENNTKVITLLEQAPDQWLVTKDLLLMRDCENGDVVIFARISTVPSVMKMEEALNSFGEDGLDGIIQCYDDYEQVTSPYWTRRYDILS